MEEVEKLMDANQCHLDNSVCKQAYESPEVDLELFDLERQNDLDDTFVVEVKSISNSSFSL